MVENGGEGVKAMMVIQEGTPIGATILPLFSIKGAMLCLRARL
jgi:hypothetical protein